MKNDEKSESSLIGPTVTIRGEIKGHRGLLVIKGSVEGAIHHDQILVIHDGGSVNADVRAREVHIEGVAKGNIHGIDRAKISASGTVEGNIYSKLFSVEEGARVKGNVVMRTDSESSARAVGAPSRRKSARKAARTRAKRALDETTPRDSSAS